MTRFKAYEEFEDFISTRIAKLRQQKNISARDMSISLGLGEAYVNHIENKSNMPSLKGLFYI
ncbi:MAG: helix-turn-helix transcriptional regulator [Clostridia bacterium]|nr:helix-turn-helix transcriptional regulator [Clostridia bacterium]